MAKQHYHVGHNTPGYLPEAEVEAYTSRREADRAATDIARDYRYEGYRVTGSASQGGYDVEDIRRSRDLGRVIFIESCSDAACLAREGRDA